jgi:hypothetical protein
VRQTVDRGQQQHHGHGTRTPQHPERTHQAQITCAAAPASIEVTSRLASDASAQKTTQQASDRVGCYAPTPDAFVP